MRDGPTTSENEFYRDNGFLSIADFLQHDELEEWRAKVDAAVMSRGDQRLSFAIEDATNIASQTSSKEEQEYYNRVFTQRVNLWQTDKEFKELLLQDALGSFVARLAGVDGLRVWHDQALIKEAYANPTSFHLDVPYWSFTSADAITVWIALDDATLENGCLFYLPGSHKARKFDNVAIGALFDIYPDWRDVRAIPCPVPAGGAVLHNGLTFHGAGANMTPGRRRAITCAYMPDGATFNGQRNVLPPEYLATLSVGDALDNEAQNPLVYGRHPH